MRFGRFPLLRALAGLAIAIASPGAALSHGVAHDHDQRGGAGHTSSHHVDAAVSAEEHAADHGHLRVSEALRIRADVSDFIPLISAVLAGDLLVISPQLSLPVSDPTLLGERTTGPPPKLRGPPID
ncbi:MAG TPA: hypothetical protein VES88_01535 [Gemmatimonadaceae bacterium]|nr:hypothetical protein [Gemmatimonadaceae bacterium]